MKLLRFLLLILSGLTGSLAWTGEKSAVVFEASEWAGEQLRIRGRLQSHDAQLVLGGKTVSVSNTGRFDFRLSSREIPAKNELRWYVVDAWGKVLQGVHPVQAQPGGIEPKQTLVMVPPPVPSPEPTRTPAAVTPVSIAEAPEGDSRELAVLSPLKVEILPTVGGLQSLASVSASDPSARRLLNGLGGALVRMNYSRNFDLFFPWNAAATGSLLVNATGGTPMIFDVAGTAVTRVYSSDRFEVKLGPRAASVGTLLAPASAIGFTPVFLAGGQLEVKWTPENSAPWNLGFASEVLIASNSVRGAGFWVSLDHPSFKLLGIKPPFGGHHWILSVVLRNVDLSQIGSAGVNRIDLGTYSVGIGVAW